jgi:outer membrane protein TolC
MDVEAGLPPSLKLRRSAEALAEAGQTRLGRSEDRPLRSPTRGGRFLAGLLLLLCPSISSAQVAPVVRLTLDQAQEMAVSNSHRLAELRAREAAAEAVVAGRLAADRPAIAASAGYTRTNHVLEFAVPSPAGGIRVLYPDVPDNYRSRLDLQWPIYTGGRSDALERAARAEAAAAGEDVSAARADLRLEAARAFWAVVTARATVAVLERGLARTEANAADVRERFKAGVVPPNEIASADAQTSRARMLLIEARNQRDVAAADLARLTGVEPAQPIEPVAALDGVAPSSAIEALVAEARGSRSERRALERRIEAVDLQRVAASAGRRPIVAVAAGFDYARPNPRIFPRAERWDDAWDAGVQVSWSLWDGGRTAAEVEQAARLGTAARERLAEFDSVLAVEVRQRALDIESGRAAASAAEDGIRAASEARRVVAERYRAGVITQIEVLDAEVALLQAELDRTRALAGVRLAQARLARAVGR